MKIQNINSLISSGAGIGRVQKDNTDPVNSYEFEQYMNRRVMPLSSKLNDVSFDYAVVDTYKDGNGRIKMKTVSLLNCEDEFDKEQYHILDNIV